MRFPSCLLALLPLATPAFAAAQQPAGSAPSSVQTLRNAWRTFAALDANADGRLEPGELTASPITAADRASFDHDGDGSFSPDEFLAYYSRLLVASGQGLGPELAREITRIRRDRQAEEARAASLARDAAPRSEDAARRSGGRTVAERLEEARRALDSSPGARAAAEAARKGRAPERSGEASGRTVEEQLERAWRALAEGSRGRDGSASPPPPSGLESRDHVAELLERARAALAD